MSNPGDRIDYRNSNTCYPKYKVKERRSLFSIRTILYIGIICALSLLYRDYTLEILKSVISIKDYGVDI